MISNDEAARGMLGDRVLKGPGDSVFPIPASNIDVRQIRIHSDKIIVHSDKEPSQEVKDYFAVNPDAEKWVKNHPGHPLSELLGGKKLGEENVVHSDHYNKGIEVIKFIESWELNFSRGSVVKYVCRAGLKNPETEVQDLEKAKQYIEFEIQRIKNLREKNS